MKHGNGTRPLHWAVAVLCAGLAIALPATSSAKGPRSLNFEFEYAVTGAGSGSAVSSGGNYDVISLFTTEGYSTGPSSSTSYSIAPMMDVPPEGTSTVGEWMLYE